MESVLLLIVAIILIYALIIYVILPIASVLAVVTLVISAGYALFVSVISFIKSLKNNLDPYATYVDKHAAAAGVKRNYCFGPGFHQISEIIKDAFENLADYRKQLTEWKDKAIRHEWTIDIWI